MNKRIQTALYICADLCMAALGWYLFFLYRKHIVEAGKHGYEVPVNHDIKLYLGLILIPLCWVLLYTATGFYRNIFRRSRLRDVQSTFTSSVVGILFIFFVLILDDSVANYRDYYLSLVVLFLLHFIPTLLLRLIITTRTIRKVQHRLWSFNTILVGTGNNAARLFAELESARKSEGFRIVSVLREHAEESSGTLPSAGSWKELPERIRLTSAEDVILALDDKDHNLVPQIVDLIQNENVHLKIMPDSYGMVMGMVKMNNILGAMLVEVDFEVMPQWQKTAKRIFDILFSTLALVIASPFLLLIAIAIRADSPGPVFFLQERIGLKGKPFRIVKFRSMRVDAENAGPQLSREHDKRHTRVGSFLRKTRLDELPQFWNVLKGEMSVVGPRPERQFFIDQIVTKAPYYLRLHRIKPGITSWGQVKFGYAENVDQMVERMKYDILYLENMSLGLDAKILIYTVLIMVQGRGK
ncbi:MAG: sugar transferase [Bacteroidetes bacterium]|nr:sugar transferase [Bacteroidota bacterium]